MHGSRSSAPAAMVLVALLVALMTAAPAVSAQYLRTAVWSNSSTCTGSASGLTFRPVSCVASGTTSSSVTCSGSSIVVNNYATTDCSGTPVSTDTVTADQCVGIAFVGTMYKCTSGIDLLSGFLAGVREETFVGSTTCAGTATGITILPRTCFTSGSNTITRNCNATTTWTTTYTSSSACTAGTGGTESGFTATGCAATGASTSTRTSCTSDAVTLKLSVLMLAALVFVACFAGVLM